MTSPSGLFFSYLLGAIFLVGGLLFLIFLDENRLLFGIPYVVIGLVMIGGVRGVHRRKLRREAEEARARLEAGDPEPG